MIIATYKNNAIHIHITPDKNTRMISLVTKLIDYCSEFAKQCLGRLIYIRWQDSPQATNLGGC